MKQQTKPEIYNLSFTATIDKKGRLTIPESTRTAANLKKDDTIQATITTVYRKEKQP